MKSSSRLIATVLTALGCVLLAAPVAAAAPPPARQALAVTIYYSTGSAAEMADEADQAAAIWNAGVTNMRLVRGTGGINVVTRNSGPAPGEASCIGCTRGTIWMYRNQITSSGASALRVMVHEFGHILSLNHPSDIGNCSKVMAGGRCTNPQPSAAEFSAVQRYWARFPAFEPGLGTESGRVLDEARVLSAA
ncbi:snapalysin family zinc-dependent metalloprotease [Lentzea sp. JNUCC 0626]|uniref:snapalysin family zinc-dependent metalloprotease n=1 Tax=Lentzea sp. JNUCC 0626 TaxID=3367513 RepID=UPI0037498F55